MTPVRIRSWVLGRVVAQMVAVIVLYQQSWWTGRNGAQLGRLGRSRVALCKVIGQVRSRSYGELMGGSRDYLLTGAGSGRVRFAQRYRGIH